MRVYFVFGLEFEQTSKVIIGFTHRPEQTGGPGTFQTRLQAMLLRDGHELVYPDDDVAPDIVFVVGGTRRLYWIWKMKRRGARVVHRLDGINWRHRVRSTSFAYYWRAEIRNLLLVWIRNYLADCVVYQSRFIQNWGCV